MGIGMVLIVPKEHAAAAARQTKGRVIGEIVEGPKTVVLV
jgi:phosphoribosylaminoimidazole (AIR) synthetase